MARGRASGHAPPPGAGRAAHRLGQVCGVLRLDRAAAGSRGRSDPDRLAPAGPDARPGGGGRPGRSPGGDDEQRQRARVGRGVRGSGPGPGRRPAGQPRAAEQPAVPGRPAARPGRPGRTGGGRRGALHQRLGARLPARLPTDPRPADRAARRHPGAGHHGDGERPGGRGRGRAAGRRRPAGGDLARTAGPGQPAARCVGPVPARGPAGLARRAPGRPAGQRDRLQPDRLGGRGHRRPAGRHRAAGAGLHRPDRPAGPGRRRRSVAAQQGEGAGGDQRARDGLRQTRPGLRDPSGRPVLAGRLLPAGGPGRPRHRAGRRPAAAGRRGPGHLAVLRHLVDAARGPGDRRARCPRRGRPAAVDCCPRDRHRRPSNPARAAAQGAGCGRRGRPGQRWLGRHRAALGVRRRAVRPGGAGPRQGGGLDARLSADRGLPDAVPGRGAGRPGRGRLRPV